MTRPPTDHPPTIARRRFLVAGLGAVLAACAGAADRATGRDPSAAAMSSSSPEPAAAATDRSPPTRPTPTSTPTSTPSPTPPTSTTSATDEPTATAAPPPQYPTGIVPATITISSIGVDAPVVDLQLTATEAQVPEDFDAAGWWVQTREPGEIGPAVIGGHVDSTTGPAVFHRLQDLRPGDEVMVADDAGETRTFVVSEPPTRVRKDERPPEVFGFGEGRPELRLITCGGDFDPTTGHYVDNVVVFCHMAGFEL